MPVKLRTGRFQIGNYLIKNLGLKIINKIEDSDSKLIIRAHGIPKEIYDKAKRMNIELLDYTCPKVLKIHDIAREYSKEVDSSNSFNNSVAKVRNS